VESLLQSRERLRAIIDEPMGIEKRNPWRYDLGCMSNPPRTIVAAAGQITARLMNEADQTLEALDALIRQAVGADLLVLPECAYPAYLLGSVASYRAGSLLSSTAFVEWLSQRAAQHRMHIVCGFVEDCGDAVYNSAVLLDDAGGEVGRTRKRFLWHADHEWYTPGDDIGVFDTALGAIGMVICAETRVPEILATLASDGAELLAMPTCWINGARTPGFYDNPQVDFLIEARAREFGIPFVCADKSGLELGAVGYVGQSRIVRADGSLVAEAPPTGDAVITATLSLCAPPKVTMDDRDRGRLLAENVTAMPDGDGARVLTIAVMPDATLARVGDVSVASSRSFAASRALALDGAELLLFDGLDDLPILRTRAMENRVFVAAMSNDRAAIIDPNGSMLALSDPNESSAVIATLDLAEAGQKRVAPKTDVFAERRPALYRF